MQVPLWVVAAAVVAVAVAAEGSQEHSKGAADPMVACMVILLRYLLVIVPNPMNSLLLYFVYQLCLQHDI